MVPHWPHHFTQEPSTHSCRGHLQLGTGVSPATPSHIHQFPSFPLHICPGTIQLFSDLGECPLLSAPLGASPSCHRVPPCPHRPWAQGRVPRGTTRARVCPKRRTTAQGHPCAGRGRKAASRTGRVREAAFVWGEGTCGTRAHELARPSPAQDEGIRVPRWPRVPGFPRVGRGCKAAPCVAPPRGTRGRSAWDEGARGTRALARVRLPPTPDKGARPSPAQDAGIRVPCRARPRRGTRA